MEWKDQLKSHIDSYLEKRNKITSALQKVLNELKLSPYSMTASVKLPSHDPWLWNVEIKTMHLGEIKFTISLDEIEYHSGKSDSYGQLTREFPEDLTGTLSEIVLNKVREELPL